MKISDISNNFTIENGKLHFSGVEIDNIVQKVGTPTFIYDAETIKDRYRYLRDNLPKEIDIFFAMKANPNIAIVKQLTSVITSYSIHYTKLYEISFSWSSKNYVFGINSSFLTCI